MVWYLISLSHLQPWGHPLVSHSSVHCCSSSSGRRTWAYRRSAARHPGPSYGSRAAGGGIRHQGGGVNWFYESVSWKGLVKPIKGGDRGSQGITTWVGILALSSLGRSSWSKKDLSCERELSTLILKGNYVRVNSLSFLFNIFAKGPVSPTCNVAQSSNCRFWCSSGPRQVAGWSLQSLSEGRGKYIKHFYS